MELVIFGTLLTMTHILGLGVLFILFCVSAAWDRRGRTSFKWILLLGSMIGLAMLFSPVIEFSFAAIKDLLLSPALWIPIAWYCGAGLLYSAGEFFLTVRRAVRDIGGRWKSYLNERQSTMERDEKGVTGNTVTKTVGEWIKIGQAEDATDEQRERVFELCRQFTNRNAHDFIEFEYNKDVKNIEPKMDRLMLSQYIGAWVVFWPFYLVSLILGDLLSEIFQTIADFVSEHCGRFVRRAFSNVFTVS